MFKSIDDLKIGTQFLEGIILSLRVIVVLCLISFTIQSVSSCIECSCFDCFKSIQHYTLLFYALGILGLNWVLTNRYKKLKNSYYNGLFEAFVEKNKDDARFNNDG